MNPLSYQIMIFVSLLHPHNPLTFVASTNFLLCMHTPSSPSPSLSILSIAHILFFLFIDLTIAHSSPYLASRPLAPPPSSILSVYPSRRALFSSNKWMYTDRSPAIH